ncbi:MAG TPA: hypothetical protein VFS83_13215 [Ktedonobacterales bacterium]|nr:hypothetical protein [Ktedonobacterales bacterium]
MNQPAMTVERATVQLSSATRQSLHGPWLLIARVAWILVALGTLALNLVMLPQFFSALLTPCAPSLHCFYLQITPYDQQIIRQTGLTRDFVATYEAATGAASMLVFYAVATVIFLRRSSDRMALLCAYALVLFGGVVFNSALSETLAVQSTAGYWIFGALYTLAESGFIVFLLVFPNGHFAPRWSRWLVPPIVAFWAYEYLSGHIYDQTFNPGTLVFFVMLLTPMAVQMYRYRRVSTPRERQQTKWVVFGSAIALIGFVIFVAAGNLIIPPEALQSNIITVLVAQTGFAIFLLLIPISIAIAILRSRLYDIDVIINRTLVYGSLTAILALIYIAGVVGVQTIVNAFAQRHNSDPSPVLIVITTLVIAALFQPLRRRLQRAIDRRFYRAKFDTARTLERFAVTLRSETDLPHLTDDLLGVITETMQPAHLSLWLRAPDRRS